METQVILAQVRTELSEKRNHFYFKMFASPTSLSQCIFTYLAR